MYNFTSNLQSVEHFLNTPKHLQQFLMKDCALVLAKAAFI